MSVHPAPRKHPIAVQCCAAVAVSAENLCRLPHVFDKVLDLPLADAAVAIKEDAEEACFVAVVEGFSSGGARARAVEVHSGVTKVVVWDLSADVGSDDGAAAFDLALCIEFVTHKCSVQLMRWTVCLLQEEWYKYHISPGK